jgi:formylglycine-generating enzyme required for sulfatase activity
MSAFALLLLALVAGPAAAQDSSMVRLPAGTYTPFYARDSVKTARSPADFQRSVSVEAFALDRDPVTNREFLDFVRSHPEWRKSQIKRIFADPQYLAHWPSDLALQSALDADRPVTHVSWFAAEAYCRAKGKNLPTTDQWEYALADAGRDRDAVRTKILAWYGQTGAHELPAVHTVSANGFGVRGLVGLVWEWTLDFNSLMSGADLRGNGTQFCGGGSLGASDPGDYASFMRYSMRSSLKAWYTTNVLGFRCATSQP